ncbi:hypothetical protein DSM100688_0143 [Bifidobacterium ramosum]|uniref:Uncharacterized protein n=1 Tax=Bifidobacterium ramosum TaxID=1798158 RepID=A0A6L4X1Z4_9BIFI|nr:hypothetical protein [Bifidobacterium ramosum]KAB8289065.1 hypothetical protein DSM100688_0143 [Bifidobacterium ramosum]
MSTNHGRTVRSNAMPATRRPVPNATPSRPQLHVVAGTTRNERRDASGFARLVVWTRSRSTSLFHIVASAVFLAATLVGALLLRTEMVQNSYEAADIEANIATLQQDVDEDQAKLDALEASLPDKAQKMGMELPKGSLTIDLSGYQKPGHGKSSTSSKSTESNKSAQSATSDQTNGTSSTEGAQ